MSYRPRTCVIQICVEGKVTFVDALEFERNQLSALSDICEDDSYQKFLHSASNDIREMHRDYGTVFNNVFDTQLAMQFLNYEKHGLAFLLETFEGLTISKKYQRYNWRTRPIIGPAMAYAADDVIYLESCSDKLRTELDESGWDNAFDQQCELVCDQTRYTEKAFDPEMWRKVKSSKKLSDDQSRATFKALYIWRHEKCLELDRAPLHVLQNDLLGQIAFRRPETKAALKKIRGMDRVRNENYSGILKAVRFSEGKREPKRKRNEGERPDAQYFERFEKLREWRNAKTETLQIPASLIASNTLIQALAEALPADESIFSSHPDFLAWKDELFRDEILDLIS